MKRIKSTVCELAVDDAGTGPKTPVVLLHSLGGNLSHWDKFVGAMRSERRVVRYDIRGHGQSGMPADMDFSVEGYAKDIGVVAGALDLQQFILIGHSISGGAVFAYAAQHPDQVTAMIALDAILDGSAHPEEVRRLSARLFTEEYPELLPVFWGQMTGSNPDVRSRLLADVSSVRQDVMAKSFQGLLDFSAGPYAGRFEGAALAIVTPSNNGPRSLHNIEPGFPHTVVHDTGHWLHLEKPEEVGRLFNGFLKYAEPRRKPDCSG